MPDEEKKPDNGKDKPIVLPLPEEASQTQHSIKIGRKTLDYYVTCGALPLKNLDNGETEAQVFYIAYTLNSPEGDPKRPLMFSFNGGPGSSSVWLHLGALGPRRVKMLDDGGMPPAPYQLVDNPETWLEHTDLVFIDPVGTGFSRATKPDFNKKYWNLKGDLESVGEVIRLYLSRSQRWSSPLFLVGESYGTTRAAGLAGQLFDKGIAFNGVLLVSTILNFQTARFTTGNDLPYLLFLPTYTATAWYHKKLPAELQQRPLREVLAEVEAWLETDYVLALMRGDALVEDRRRDMTGQLARFTGLEERFIDHSDLRIDIHRFCKELLRDQRRTVGRLDSRFQGLDRLPITEYPDFDPSLTAITPPYTAMMNQYVRSELNYKTDLEYEILSFKVNGEWKYEGGQFPDTSEMLRSAFARNPHMKLLVAQGYYDLATPYYAADYTLNHMGLNPAVRGNIRTTFYEAGHMMYIDVASMKQLKSDVSAFIEFAL